jgi:hypothetical protein
MPDNGTKTTTLFSLETLKAWIKVTGIDDREDPRLVIAGDGATAEIETELDVLFVKRSVVETRSGDGKSTLVLQNAPVVSIDSFTVDGSAVAASAYALDADTGIIAMTSAFNVGVKNVVIGYTCGYDVQDGDGLPSDIYRAGLDLAKAIYDELASGAIAATSVSLGASTMVIKTAKRPPSVQRVIDNWAGKGFRP